MYFRAAAVAQQGVRCRNPNLVTTACGSMRCVLVEKTCFLFANIKVLTYVKLNSGLSPDFIVQLNVSLSKRLSRRLSQKVKSPIVHLRI